MRSKLEELIQTDHRADGRGRLHFDAARSRANASAGSARRRRVMSQPGPVTFEVTDKALGFPRLSRAARSARLAQAKSSFGRHDTREQATGVETTGAAQALRIWRHAQPRRHQHAAERRPARSRSRATSTRHPTRHQHPHPHPTRRHQHPAPSTRHADRVPSHVTHRDLMGTMASIKARVRPC